MARWSVPSPRATAMLLLESESSRSRESTEAAWRVRGCGRRGRRAPEVGSGGRGGGPRWVGRQKSEGARRESTGASSCSAWLEVASVCPHTFRARLDTQKHAGRTQGFNGSAQLRLGASLFRAGAQASSSAGLSSSMPATPASAPARRHAISTQERNTPLATSSSTGLSSSTPAMTAAGMSHFEYWRTISRKRCSSPPVCAR